MNNIIKYFSFLFLLAFFISPFFSFAQEAQLVNSNSNDCVSINRNLRFGVSDRVLNSQDVLTLQNFLREKGYLNATPNGYFGPLTAEAVRALQRENNLPAFGFFGPLTRELVSCKENQNQNETTEVIREAQVQTDEASNSEQSSVKEEVKQETNTASVDANNTEEITEELVPVEIKKTPIPKPKFTPRVMFWPGKVNQHINLENGLWETDPDGVSGGHSYLLFSNDYGGIEIKYCQKWYPLTIGVKEYKLETISTWKERGNLNNHTSTRMSFECIQPEITNPDNDSYFFRIETPDGGEIYVPGQSIALKWKNNKASENKKVNIDLINKSGNSDIKIPLLKDTINDGEENVILPVSGTPGIVWGKNFQLHMFALDENKQKFYEDFSKDFFTIETASIVYTENTATIVESSLNTQVSETNTNPETNTTNTTNTENNTQSVDMTPRINYWSGKVNQHIDSSGAWQTDPDGSSGAGINKLTYCQKWYPTTTSTRDYKVETITTWKAAGNTGNYTSARMSTECVGGIVLGSSIEKNPNICQIEANLLLKGMKSSQVKCLQQKLNQKGYKVVGTEGGKETTEFGYQTWSALRKFQSANNLKTDGVFGPQTKALLFK